MLIFLAALAGGLIGVAFMAIFSVAGESAHAPPDLSVLTMDEPIGYLRNGTDFVPYRWEGVPGEAPGDVPVSIEVAVVRYGWKVLYEAVPQEAGLEAERAAAADAAYCRADESMAQSRQLRASIKEA